MSIIEPNILDFEEFSDLETQYFNDSDDSLLFDDLDQDNLPELSTSFSDSENQSLAEKSEALLVSDIEQAILKSSARILDYESGLRSNNCSDVAIVLNVVSEENQQFLIEFKEISQIEDIDVCDDLSADYKFDTIGLKNYLLKWSEVLECKNDNRIPKVLELQSLINHVENDFLSLKKNEEFEHGARFLDAIKNSSLENPYFIDASRQSLSFCTYISEHLPIVYMSEYSDSLIAIDSSKQSEDDGKSELSSELVTKKTPVIFIQFASFIEESLIVDFLNGLDQFLPQGIPSEMIEKPSEEKQKKKESRNISTSETSKKFQPQVKTNNKTESSSKPLLTNIKTDAEYQRILSEAIRDGKIRV